MCFFQPDRGTDSRMPCMEPWFTSLVFDPTSWLCSFMWRCIPALPNRICAHHSKLTSFTNYPPSCSKDMWRRRSCKERWITTPFLFSICLSFLRSRISLLNFLNPWLLPFHGLLSAVFQPYLHHSRCISDQLLVALTIFFPIILKFNNFPLPYNFFQDLFICVGILLFADFLASWWKLTL